MQSQHAPTLARDTAQHGSTDPWRLVHARRPTESDRATLESLFALANGVLGVRGGLEEGASRTQGTFLTGVWERTPIEYHERFPGFARNTDTRLPVADGTHIGLRLGETLVDLDDGEWLSFEQGLDLRNGCLQRTLHWRSPTGVTLQIDAERIVPLHTPNLVCIRYRVTSIDYRGPITLESALMANATAAEQGEDPRIGTRVMGGLSITASDSDHTLASICQRTQHSHIRLASGQRHRLPEQGLTFARAIIEDDLGVQQHYAGQLHPGQSVLLEKYIAYAWSLPEGGDAETALLNTVATSLEDALSLSFDAHLADQAKACAAFWQGVDLAIDGDPSVEQALRLNLFHLLQSTSRDGSGSAAAKGLTGEGYEGHYFWDAEAFILPVLALTSPQHARGMLQYRVRTLDRARAHAREMNHPIGALYAWRTISGDECSAYFPSGSAQYHINAAIAFAIQLYVESSGDVDFLVHGGAETLFETARLWLQVGYYNPRRGHAFCICQVTGPDEYTALVDNNYYTNHMAQQHLRYAGAIARQLAHEHPLDYARIAASIDLTDNEVAAWLAAADAMYLPVDAKLGIFPQDDDFLDKPRLPIAHADGQGHRPLLLRMHPLTIYRHQVCKQADVLQAFVLAGHAIDQDSKRRNFDYYEGVTVHDSTLSASTFSIVAAEVGYASKAYRYFLDTLRVDLDNLHGNTSHGVHMAAMAGSWLALTWGFGGLRTVNGRPSFAPALPQAWNGYRFGLRWRQAHIRVAVDAGGVEYTLTEGAQIEILHHGQSVLLSKGYPVRRALPSQAPETSLKGVIFDLDGVIADTAVVHHAAWKKLAAEIGIPFDDSVGERLKGVDRRASLDILLEQSPRIYSEPEKEDLATRKNTYYRQQIERFGPQNLLPGAKSAIESVRRAGLKTALASASRNAPLLLEKLGIADLFDYVVDANHISRAKPDPEIFLAAARGLGLAPSECLGVEDAAAGIASIHSAGMKAVGIGHAHALAEADLLLPDVAAFDIGRLMT
ncbi:MAG TPA: beta-phosphoglucomutase [Dyella sp.]|uniref:beta-phosphoglucomutase n=1 Tax=Dyella sp. TaxID=1869338 RepID=UPI002B732510|nr:beta-phosphoglucomutase [Dyella sp.]HTV86099.1 beta-phosphoglucomutase [Dyella sp.]